MGKERERRGRNGRGLEKDIDLRQVREKTEGEGGRDRDWKGGGGREKNGGYGQGRLTERWEKDN